MAPLLPHSHSIIFSHGDAAWAVRKFHASAFVVNLSSCEPGTTAASIRQSYPAAKRVYCICSRLAGP
jgi:hypothetical protein